MSTAPAHSDPLLEAALYYVSQGWQVFPLPKGGKMPFRGPSWHDYKTLDPAQVQAWWGGSHAGCNIAVVCASPLMVFDFDVKGTANGLETALKLLGPGWEDRYAHVRTPSKGVHVYMTNDIEQRNRKLGAQGMDLQAGGGCYVVAPPSVLDDSEPGNVPGPYLMVGGARPVQYVTDEYVTNNLRVFLAQVDASSTKNHSDDSMPDYEEAVDFQWEAASHVMLRQVTAFLLSGDASGYGGDGSAALFGVAHALFKLQASPAQVLKTMVHNEHCWAVATAPHRKADGRGADQWLWEYTVRPAMPMSPLDLGFGETTGAGGVAPVDTTVVHGPSEYEQWRDSALTQPPHDPQWVKPFIEGMLQSNLNPAEFDMVRSAVIQRSGVRSKYLDKTIAECKRERTARMRASKTAKLAIEDRYASVEGQNKLWSFDDAQWIQPGAFMRRWGEPGENGDAAAADALRMVKTVGTTTYWPLNPWAEGFDEVAGRYPVYAETGMEQLNLWQRPRNFEPVAADVVIAEGKGEPNTIWPWLNLMREKTRVPRADEQHVLDWMAFTLQHPERKINHMLLLGGEQGIGKDSLLKPVMHALGQGNCIEVHGIDFGDDAFAPNGIEHAKLMTVTELKVDNAADAEKLTLRLKPWIATNGSLLPINPKFGHKMVIPNLVNTIGHSNHRMAIHLDANQRRYFMCWCDGVPQQMNAEYWDDLNEWYEYKGGYELVVRWLLNRDVSGFRSMGKPPSTEWSDTTIDDSLSALAKTLRDHVLLLDTLPDVVTAAELVHAATAYIPSQKPPHLTAIGHAMAALGIPARALHPPRVNGVRGNRRTYYLIRNAERWREVAALEVYAHRGEDCLDAPWLS